MKACVERGWRTAWRGGDDVWKTTEQRRHDGRNGKHEDDGGASRQKRDDRTTLTTMTMTMKHDVRTMTWEARWQDGNEDSKRNVTTGRWRRQQKQRDRTLTTTAETRCRDSDDDRRNVMTGRWRRRLERELRTMAGTWRIDDDDDGWNATLRRWW